MKIVVGEGKKARNFGPPTLWGPTMTHTRSKNRLAKIGLAKIGGRAKTTMAKIGLAKIGQIRMAKTGLAKVSLFHSTQHIGKSCRHWTGHS